MEYKVLVKVEISDWARISNADRGASLEDLRNGVPRGMTQERSEPKRHEKGGWWAQLRDDWTREAGCAMWDGGRGAGKGKGKGKGRGSAGPREMDYCNK